MKQVCQQQKEWAEYKAFSCLSNVVHKITCSVGLIQDLKGKKQKHTIPQLLRWIWGIFLTSPCLQLNSL